MAACYEVFNKVETINYNKNAKTDLYLRNFNNQFIKPIRGVSKLTKIYSFIKRTFFILHMSFINKDYRIFLFKSLTDKNWYSQKLIQFGIKKMVKSSNKNITKDS